MGDLEDTLMERGRGINLAAGHIYPLSAARPGGCIPLWPRLPWLMGKGAMLATLAYLVRLIFLVFARKPALYFLVQAREPTLVPDLGNARVGSAHNTRSTGCYGGDTRPDFSSEIYGTLSAKA